MNKLENFLRETVEHFSFGTNKKTERVYSDFKNNNPINDLIIDVFAYIHSTLNYCFAQLNKRGCNSHFTANDNREMLRIIDVYKELKIITSNSEYSFEINTTYLKQMDFCKAFVRDTCGSTIPDNFERIELIEYEPIFSFCKKHNFANVKHLIFGAAKTKPDIRVSDVFDGNLDVLNHNDVLVYDDEIKDSILYVDFNVWWEKNKVKYSWYKPAEQMNEMELKFAKYYQDNYRADNFPVLIPQVYLHYDPKGKEIRKNYKHTKTLTFQRMDFLIIYKGKRAIIELDGKTHTQENSLEQYSLQTEYDRTMKFLGYDVFRIGGYELRCNFEETVKYFFDNLIKYLEIK